MALEEPSIRISIWRQLTHLLPVFIFINKSTGIFSVKNKEGGYIYADDLERGELNLVFREWAEYIFQVSPDTFANDVEKSITSMRLRKSFGCISFGDTQHKTDYRLSARLINKTPLQIEFCISEN